MKHLKLILAGLALLSLTACGTTLPQTPQVRIELPDESLLGECRIGSIPSSRTNEGVVLLASSYKAALKRCNDDKAALRAWYEGVK